MILTDKVVYIHMPKTGGTFVTSVLERIHEAPLPSRLQKLRRRIQRRLGFPAPDLPNKYGRLQNIDPKHGTCHDIPPSHADLPILSCMRGPWEWYVSQYEFSWWKRVSEYDPNGPSTPAGWAIERVLPGFVKAKPHFPDVSFAEFMELCDQAADVYNREDGTDLGLYTHGFIRYYYRDPSAVLRKMSEQYLVSTDHRRDRFDIIFLNTERLAVDLQQALIDLDYHSDDIAFVSHLGKILPMGIGRTEDQDWKQYYDDPLKASVRQRDRFLFKLFPEYDQTFCEGPASAF